MSSSMRGSRGTWRTEQVVRVEDLGDLIREKRRSEGLTLDQAAVQTGVSAATLSRWERQGAAGLGGDTRRRVQPDTRTLAAITGWLGVSIERLMDMAHPRAVYEIVHREGETVPDMLDAHLRADPNLDSATAAALGRMFRVAYEQFSELRVNDDEQPTKDQAHDNQGAGTRRMTSGDEGGYDGPG